MNLSSKKNFEIVCCLHLWERSWLDKRQVVELNPWTSGRSMSVQFNSAVRMIDSNQKHKQESQQQAKTLQLSDCQLVTIRIAPVDPPRQEVGE